MKKFLILFAVASVALSCGSKDVDVDDFEMIYVKGGTFTMGATAEQGIDASYDETPAHSVTLSDYYIGKYEITQAQWRAVMGSNPSHFTGDNNPVEQVSWDDIQQFITKLNAQTGKKFRLPTEAEWEYAARGGNKSKGYKYSGSNTIADVAWYDGNSKSKTHPVGTKQPNELGIYDMSGNVWELCQDWYGSYSRSSQTNPTGPSSGSNRVLRGGGWYYGARGCRVSNRDGSSPGDRDNDYGFRLACSVESVSQATSSPSQPGNYKIGDIVTVNGVKGVVFQTSPVVKIVSVKEGYTEWGEEEVTTNGKDKDNGKANMAKIKSISGWETKYPAFKWCADYGNGWYLPALNELKAIYAQRDKINKTLSVNNMDKLGSKDSYSYIWSSSEDDDYYAYNVSFSVGDVSYGYKNDDYAVRAVLVLDGGATTPAQTSSSSSATIGGFEMVYVEGGTFTMGATAEQGSDAYEEKPTHSVTLSDYYIGKYEVTQAQWRAVMGSNPSKFTGDNNPVEQVFWYDIQEFITKLNAQTGKKFRLPTEAEWEYAARGGNKSKGYKYSGSNSIDDVAWYDGNSGNEIHPVGQKTPNELGIYDMSGNVWEWCQDWYGDYSSESQTNPTGPSSGSSRVLRGGSWYSFAEYCRVSNRNSRSPGYRSFSYGFRLACSVESVSQATSSPSQPGNYKIGDIVTVNGVKGVVFQTSPVVKIVSVAETTAKWSPEYKITGATDKDNGKANITKIKSISGWQSKYPAFKWCADLGDGWYLPAFNELKAIYNQKDAINKTLSANGFDRLGSKDSYNCIWSSSESINDGAYLVDFSSGNVYGGDKYGSNAVRAVLVLDGGTTTPTQTSSSSSATIGGFEMVYVKGGTFTMGATVEQGSDAEIDEKPTHSVTVSDFYIGKYEVTQAQWKAVMGTNPSNWKGDNLPVENVSWNDVQEFITKLNAQTGKKFRLPTEAEWEYAARGGNQSKGYKHSGSNNISEVAWYGDNSSSKTHPVGQKSPNELGIYDMSGNVYEWCQDWYGSYSRSSQTNPTGPSSGSNRVLRGGGWYYGARSCRVSGRDYGSPGYRSYLSGFRLACLVE